MIEPESESRDAKTLEPLFKHHRLWKRMRAIIEKGVDYPLEDISNKTLKEDLRAMIQRGNYKSAQLQANETSLLKNYKKK